MLVLLMLAMAANGVVTRPVANLYSGPSDDQDVVSQAIYATNVSILEEKDGWAKIQTPDEYTGWTKSSDLLKTVPYATRGKTVQVENLFAHIYREPSVTKHAPVVTVPYETHLEVVAEPDDNEGRWLQVRLPDDRSGWVQRGDVTFDLKKLTVPETIEFARRFLGLPYTWGGTSSYGYDCSGYMQMLCRRRGVLMPRDAGPQSRWSGVIEVSKDQLQPGDLLYFGPSEKKITHTGMYIGNGQFINATTYLKPMIQINDLSDPHWTKLLVAQRRLK